MSANYIKLIEKLLRFSFFSDGVSLLLSHPGWGPATAELQTSNYRDFEQSAKSDVLSSFFSDHLEHNLVYLDSPTPT